MLNASTLRPGLLVSLKTTISGNVSYQKQEIEADHLTTAGERRARWETERTITNPDEHEEAVKVRGKCRSLISSVCASSTFGLLCPESKSDELARMVRESQDLAADFNARSEITRIGVYVIVGRVAQDDVQAVRAINSEVRDLLETMERGLQTLDVETVRAAANKARSIGSMLSPDAQSRIKGAIDTARSAARQIVKASEEGIAEIDHAALSKLRESRSAFLDLDGDTEIVAPVAVGRPIDLIPDDEGALADDLDATEDKAAVPPRTVPSIELEEDEPQKLSAAPRFPALDLE